MNFSEEGNNNRTVYLGGIDPETTCNEVLNHVHSGLIDSIKILAEKGCAFISFVDPTSASSFYREVSVSRLQIRDREVKIGWGKPKPIPTEVLTAVENGATRNVFIGGIDESLDEQFLRNELHRFGEIEHIRIIYDKKVAFVHFTTLNSALKCVSTIQKESKFGRFKINYGKDRCASMANNKRPQPHLPPVPLPVTLPDGSPVPITPYQDRQPDILRQNSQSPSNIPTRTIYVGGIDTNTNPEDLSEVIRGGPIDNIKIMPEKNCAFITFVYPESAQIFYDYVMSQGLTVKGRQVKVGWGKPIPLPMEVSMAVERGATRNVYIGSVDDSITEDKFRNDVSHLGYIDNITILHEKRCAFVSFTSVISAMKAVEYLSNHPHYDRFRINFGKDSCARMPSAPRIQNMNFGHHHYPHHQPVNMNVPRGPYPIPDNKLPLPHLPHNHNQMQSHIHNGFSHPSASELPSNPRNDLGYTFYSY